MSAVDSETRVKIQWDWKATVLALALLPVLLWLGFWQMDRAEEKKQLQALYNKRMASPALPLSALQTPEAMRYQPVIIEGEYLPQWNLLLDNKVYRGSFGYEILTAFKLNNKQQWIWVNRGWIAGDRARLSLPNIPLPPSGQQHVNAEIYIPQGKVMQLGEDNNKAWPRVVQAINIQALAKELKQDMFPYSARLAPAEAGVLERNWLVVNIEPAKHTGYAVQWFALAVVAIIITLLANTNIWAVRKAKRENKK